MIFNEIVYLLDKLYVFLSTMDFVDIPSLYK